MVQPDLGVGDVIICAVIIACRFYAAGRGNESAMKRRYQCYAVILDFVRFRLPWMPAGSYLIAISHLGYVHHVLCSSLAASKGHGTTDGHGISRQ